MAYPIKKNRYWFIALMVFLPLWGNAAAAIWYVTPTGNDTNTCTAKTTPCKTIQGVHNKVAFLAGDQIYMMQGTYNNNGANCQISLSKATEIYGGYNAAFTSRTKDPSKTIITDTKISPSASVCRLFAINSGHVKWTVFDGVKLTGVADPGSHAGTVLTYGAGLGALLRFNNVIISNNNVTNGGAIQADIAGDKIEINNSMLENNTARGGSGGAISIASGVRLNVTSSIINGNSASVTGGGIYMAGGSIAELESTTIYDNKAVGQGGGIYITGANTSLACVHCTIVKNTSTTLATLARNVVAVSSASLYLKNSVIINEDKGSSTSGWNISVTGGATLSEGGYNAFGINNQAGFSAGLAVPTGTNIVNTEANIAVLFANKAANNGGTIKSLMPVADSPLIDAIPNDVPESSTGTTPTLPFTSIAQAHAAMGAYDHYKAGYYFFNLEGQAFKTYVDKNGYVLVASGNASSEVFLEQTSNLELQSDKILPSTTFAKLVGINEIRINSPESKLGNFDMVTKNATNITRLKSYLPLYNNYELGILTPNTYPSLWVGTHDDRMGGASCSHIAVYAATKLYQNILGHCGDATDFYWQMQRAGGPYVTVRLDAPTPSDRMNLWVRSSTSSCGGVVKVDQRGLPLPDYVNPNDPTQYGDIRNCDIGAFEWNDGYRLDCYDEDGSRPENSLAAGTATVCFSDPNSVTPKALIDNFGSTHWQLLMLLCFSGLARWRKKVNSVKLAAALVTKI